MWASITTRPTLRQPAFDAGGKKWGRRGFLVHSNCSLRPMAAAATARVLAWEVALQKLADDIELTLTVSHFPPGTSKWNKVEHRLFSFITNNWRGKPLVSHQAIVNLIASTKTNKGLIVKAALDENTYETGIEVSDEQMAKLKLVPAQFHGDWNYTIKPRRQS
jgi:hypothetical protein